MKLIGHLLRVADWVVSTAGEDGADVDLLAGVDVQFGEHAVGRRGDGVLHLHRLQPDHRLAGGDRVADRGADPDDRAGHRRQQRTLRDGGVRIGEARQRGSCTGPSGESTNTSSP